MALRRSLCAALLFVLTGAAPVSAQYLKLYKDGIEAVRSGDWERAAELMEQAIEERAEEKMRLPARLYMRAYLPHYFLGLARYQLGDCAGAIAAWQESERQGVLPQLDGEMAEVGKGIAACRRLADRERERAAIREELEQASAVASRLLEQAGSDVTSEIWRAGDPAPAERHRDGLALVAGARARLDKEPLTDQEIREARELAQAAGELFARLRDDVARLAAQRQEVRSTRATSIETLLAAARDLLEGTAYLAPYPHQLGKARADLRGLLEEAERRQGAGTADYLEGLQARISNSLANLDALSRPPPPELAQGVEKYLRGEYGSVVQSLAPARFESGRARAHAHLLMAAARHALYLEGGEADEELREAAAQSARDCRRHHRRLVPSRRLFSPRFVEFFEDVVSSEA